MPDIKKVKLPHVSYRFVVHVRVMEGSVSWENCQDSLLATFTFEGCASLYLLLVRQKKMRVSASKHGSHSDLRHNQPTRIADLRGKDRPFFHGGVSPRQPSHGRLNVVMPQSLTSSLVN